MNVRITPSNITKLKEYEIFVFGSNSNGVHNGNAAATAMKFGAIMGQAVGIQGQTYALPSKHIENLKKHIDDFLLYAEQHPEYIFLVTEIGCGISKHSPFEIAPLFKEAVHIKNINLPLSFWDVLNGGIQARIKQIAEKESPSVPDFCQRTRLSFTIGEFYQFNLSSCIRQQNSLTAQFVSFSLANLANIFYPPPRFLQ